jgi:carbamoyltransferase
VKVLGVVAKTHDSGIALVEDGVPKLIFEEERFNRVKKTKKFPKQSLAAARADYDLNIADVDVITTPWDVRQLRRTASRLLMRRFPLSLSLLLPSTHESQQNQIMVLNSYLRHGLRKSFACSTLPPIVNVGHHDSHAAVFFVSPFEEALVLVMDGYGDDSSSSAYLGRGTQLERKWSTEVLNSVGLVYTFVTQHLGFAGFGDEGKVMALAAFGSATYVKKFRDVIRSTADGGYVVDMSYFSYDKFGLLRPFSRKFLDTFGPARRPDEPLADRHRDLAYALQSVTEEVILNRVRSLLKQYPVGDLCLSGGVALNCVANAKVLEATDVRRVWVPPCASDTGAPFGSALWHTHQTLGLPRRFELTHPYYGRAYKDDAIVRALEAEGLRYHRLPTAQLLRRVAKDLADGKIVGWFQDRFEMGPRALGNRSILADPRRAEMRNELNDRVKKREPFRPFAPVILAEKAAEYFEVTQADPFMTLAPRVRTEKQSVIPAAVHIDGTGRIQTIDRAANPRYYGLIEEFARLTGVPVLLNTSFNRKEPIVAAPKDAIACYLLSGIDVLVVGDFYTTDRRNPAGEACAMPAAALGSEATAIAPASQS